MDTQFEHVMQQIQQTRSAENATSSAPGMTSEVRQLAVAKRIAFDEPPTAVKTDPLR